VVSRFQGLGPGISVAGADDLDPERTPGVIGDEAGAGGEHG